VSTPFSIEHPHAEGEVPEESQDEKKGKNSPGKQDDQRIAVAREAEEKVHETNPDQDVHTYIIARKRLDGVEGP
jgi:hypothetical protein